MVESHADAGLVCFICAWDIQIKTETLSSLPICTSLYNETRTQCHSANPFKPIEKTTKIVSTTAYIHIHGYSLLHKTCVVQVYLFNNILFKFSISSASITRNIRSQYMFLHNKLCDYRKKHNNWNSYTVLSVNIILLKRLWIEFCEHKNICF